VDKDFLVQDAQRRASQIIEQARIEADNIRAGADQYAKEKLMDLERSVQVLINQIRNGVRVLEEKQSVTKISNPTEK